MVDTKLTWKDTDSGEDGYNVYRSSKVISDVNLPTPLVKLASNATAYVDNLQVEEIANYRIGSRLGGKSRSDWLTPNRKIMSGNLDLFMDFTDERTFRQPQQDSPLLSSLLTDTWSGGVLPDVDGNFSSFAANALARTNKGLWTQPESRSILRQNNLASALIGDISTTGRLPSGLAQGSNSLGVKTEVIGTGIENGLPYVDIRYTAAAVTDGQVTSYFSTDGEIEGGKTISVTYLTRILSYTGSLSTKPRARLAGNTSGGSWNNDEINIYFNASSEIKTLKRTMKADSTRLSIGIHMAASGAAVGTPLDLTLRVGVWSAEIKPFTTQPIITSGSTVTRDGNKQVFELGDKLKYGVAGFIKYETLGLAGTVERILQFSGLGKSANRLGIFNNGGTTSITSAANNSGDGSVYSFATSQLGPGVIAFAATQNYLIARKVGSSAQSPDTSVTYPPIITMAIGCNFDVTTENSYQLTKKLGLVFGTVDKPISAEVFDKMYALAQLV